MRKAARTPGLSPGGGGQALVAMGILAVLAAGCAGLQTGEPYTYDTGAGRVEMDFASRRHLEVTRHDSTTEEGTVQAVTVQWRNVSDSDFSVRIRADFYGPDGDGVGNGAEGWVSFTIPPGGTQVFRWSAPGERAAVYVIKVRSAGWWPF